MLNKRYSITFACYNQVEYTRQCIDSMLKHGLDLSCLVVVDNASQDGTRDYLASLPLGGLILNEQNMGCGVAWNQGALALQTEWTIIMNNDVIVSANWVENLIATAEKRQLKVISPALIEGDLDYDFDSFAADASQKMQNVMRPTQHAVCLAVHRSVWMEVGYFQPIPKLLGFEDTMFFHELQKANIACGMTGASWLHHFGSITQSAMKQERGLSQKDGLANRYHYKLLQQNWWQRKWNKFTLKQQKKRQCQQELASYGMTLHGIRAQHTFHWK
jgi:GT2 family glycosyltransferase